MFGRGAFGLVVVLSLACLIWTLIPGARQQVTLVPPPVSFNSYILTITNIQLDVPKTLRPGELERIRLMVNPLESDASGPVLAQARLELLAAELTPGEQILTALSTIGPTRFEWEIRLIEEGELTGTLWLTFQIWRGKPNGAGLSTGIPGTAVGRDKPADCEVGRLVWPGNWAGRMDLEIPEKKVRFIPNIQCNFYVMNR